MTDKFSVELTAEEIDTLLDWFGYKEGGIHMYAEDTELYAKLQAVIAPPSEPVCNCCTFGCCADPEHCCQKHVCGKPNYHYERVLVSS